MCKTYIMAQMTMKTGMAGRPGEVWQILLAVLTWRGLVTFVRGIQRCSRRCLGCWNHLAWQRMCGECFGMRERAARCCL